MAQSSKNNRTIGIYPETKTPSFFNNFLNRSNSTLTMEDILLRSLEKYGYRKETSPCFVQSFSKASLKYMSTRTNLSLVFLASGSLSNTELAELSTFCYGIGTSKNAIVQVNSENYIATTTDFIERAHNYDLKVNICQAAIVVSMFCT